MDPLIVASLISGASSLAGAGIGAWGQSEMNEMSMEMFEKQMAFQKDMYMNRHTYEVDDLRRAGLNPILSANSAASAPMGSAPVSLQNPLGGLAGALSTSARNFADINLTKEQAKTQESVQEVNKAQAELISNQADIAKANSAVAARNAKYETGGFGNVIKWLDILLSPIKGILGGSVTKHVD